MLKRLVLLIGVAFALALPVLAQGTPLYTAERQAELDALFADLAEAPDPAAAQTLADQIWRIWMEPDEPELAGRMAETLDLRWKGDMAALLAALDGIIADYPEYAEAYNQRATVNFMLGREEEALPDIAATLEREPRHFGALSGRAMILRNLGQYDAALADMRAGLAIHPFLGERTLFPELMVPELAI